jgi:hypothetical protein
MSTFIFRPQPLARSLCRWLHVVVGARSRWPLGSRCAAKVTTKGFRVIKKIHSLSAAILPFKLPQCLRVSPPYRLARLRARAFAATAACAFLPLKNHIFSTDILFHYHSTPHMALPSATRGATPNTASSPCSTPATITGSPLWLTVCGSGAAPAFASARSTQQLAPSTDAC